MSDGCPLRIRARRHSRREIMLKRTVMRLSILCALAVVLSGCTLEPDAPDGLVVRAVSSSSIALSWSGVSPTPDEYYIYRKTIYDSNYTRVARVNYYYTSYTDTGLSANTTYYYKVSAYDDGREGDWSDSNYATTWP
jgi:fibronectin type 3 domain-containing protein